MNEADVTSVTNLSLILS